MNLLIASQLMLTLAGTTEGAPRAARLIPEQRLLLDQRPSLAPAVNMMVVSGVAGVGAAVLWGLAAMPRSAEGGFYGATSAALSTFLLCFFAVILTTANVALGVVSTILLPIRIRERERIDAEVARLEL